MQNEVTIKGPFLLTLKDWNIFKYENVNFHNTNW